MEYLRENNKDREIIRRVGRRREVGEEEEKETYVVRQYIRKRNTGKERAQEVILFFFYKWSLKWTRVQVMELRKSKRRKRCVNDKDIPCEYSPTQAKKILVGSPSYAGHTMTYWATVPLENPSRRFGK